MSNSQKDKWIARFKDQMENNKLLTKTTTVETEGDVTITTTQINLGPKLEGRFSFDSSGMGHLSPRSRERLETFFAKTKVILIL
jgi:hypothetical protein